MSLGYIATVLEYKYPIFKQYTYLFIVLLIVRFII
jgi:hypothetical protein